ncbi:MAG: DUF6288 domain-containing protein [Phycisphaerales bacterium]
MNLMARIGIGTTAWAVLSAFGPAGAPPDDSSNPDFTRGETVPEGATHDWNLGPTGLRGWMHSNRLETTEARQIMVTSVAPGSPAEGVVAVGDVLLGVDGRRFAFDPRVEFGRAIGRAEAADGRLSLIRWRDGRTDEAVVAIETLGPYSPTAPFECAKSRAVLEQGCEAIAAAMRENPDDGNPIERCYAALALLACGDPEHLPLVKAQVDWASTYSDLDRRQLHSWWYGPVNLLLAEYVLATGDRSVLPALERVTMEIVRGQSEVGSWGHRFVQKNGRLAGYGMMNAPGLPLTISLVLAREAGVESPELDEAIAKSAGLVRFYVGKGSVPYGDHHPWIETHDDNGKNGAAAVLFNLLGDAEAVEYFSRMSVASHGNERDNGHTGNYFNMLWAMPGVALSGPVASGAWMNEFGWYYDLARRWDGGFTHQGPPQTKPDSYRGWDATGLFMLAYAQPGRRLAITGRTPSVAPQMNRREAEVVVRDGRDWGSRTRLESWSSRSERTLLRNLTSWSPVVRERAAMVLAEREEIPIDRLRRMLTRGDLEARLGACQAAAQLKGRAAPLLGALEPLLGADDLWLRIKAAEAIAAVGAPAMPLLPRLLEMLAAGPDASDPRGMQQRYLCFALFDRRDGMVGRSLEGVDRDALRNAVVAGLRNEDGRARGAIGSVYRRLSFEELEPLMPSILQAMREPSPSGIMFADEIRLAGLDLFAEHGIVDGVPLCIDLIDPDRWGMGNRIERCLNALRTYGGAASGEVPRLRELHEDLVARKWDPKRLESLDIPGRIREIENDDEPRTLRSVSAPSAES